MSKIDEKEDVHLIEQLMKHSLNHIKFLDKSPIFDDAIPFVQKNKKSTVFKLIISSLIKGKISESFQLIPPKLDKEYPGLRSASLYLLARTDDNRVHYATFWINSQKVTCQLFYPVLTEEEKEHLDEIDEEIAKGNLPDEMDHNLGSFIHRPNSYDVLLMRNKHNGTTHGVAKYRLADGHVMKYYNYKRMDYNFQVPYVPEKEDIPKSAHFSAAEDEPIRAENIYKDSSEKVPSMENPMKKPRGRPKGSVKTPSVPKVTKPLPKATVPNPLAAKRGRPKGSRNKSKDDLGGTGLYFPIRKSATLNYLYRR